MERDDPVRVWAYPWWLRAGLTVLFVVTAWGAFAATWPGILALYGYGAPLLTAWACLEAYRRRLTLTTTHLESRDMLGGVRRISLDDIVQIAFGLRPALTVTDREGNSVEVPRLFGKIRSIAGAIAAAAEARGVRIERSAARR